MTIPFPPSPAELVLLGLTFIFGCIQVVYYLQTYSRPYRRRRLNDNVKEDEHQEPVSIIVYSRNESENLKKHLPILLSQRYSTYEVVVINDGSTDESDDVLNHYKVQYPNLYHTFIPQESKYISRRKLSLTLGVKAAKYDLLLFIEANCLPISENWIARMVSNYDSHTELVLGYCSYPWDRGFFHKLVGYDNLLDGLQYLSAAIIHSPYCGNGRNLSYRKSLFFSHKGYGHSLNLHAGDDDLFVNEVATRYNTKTEYSDESLTEMKPIERFGVWKEMKTSRAATQSHYHGSRLNMYRFETLTCLLFNVGVLASVVLGIILKNPATVGPALGLYITVYAIKTSVLKRAALMLRQKLSISLLPAFELTRMFFSVYIIIYRAFKGERDYTFTTSGGRRS